MMFFQISLLFSKLFISLSTSETLATSTSPLDTTTFVVAHEFVTQKIVHLTAATVSFEYTSKSEFSNKTNAHIINPTRTKK